MFSLQELSGIPLFANLEPKALEYLAGCSADMRVKRGEYVVHEGESRRALFVVVEGTLEATKIVDGIERVVGVRRHGQLFGEVPVVLNTPFLASLRAAEDSRVMQIEVRDFHAVAAMAPDVASTVGAAALDRVEGLQEIAAEVKTREITVVGPKWHAGCHALRDFLQRNSVEFDWLVPEDPAASAILAGAGGEPHYPLVRMHDGLILSAPTTREIASAAGLSVSPQYDRYDVVIVGGGPAGLAAAVYGASEGLSTILIEREAPGGQAGTSSRIENYLGFPFGVSGDELADRALKQAKRLGAEIVVTRSVKRIDAATRTVVLDGDEELRGRTIVLALGVAWRRLANPGIEALRGRGVYYGAARGEAKLVQGMDVFVIGAGNSAGQAAMNFSNYARTVTLLVRGNSLGSSMSQYLIDQIENKENIRVETQSEVVAVHGEEHLEAIDVTNRQTGKTARRDAGALFVMIGADAETAWLPAAIARDERGYILTGPALGAGLWTTDRDPLPLETSVPGIFATGDARAGSVKRVAAGVGEGSMAIALVHQFLQYEAQRTATTATP